MLSTTLILGLVIIITQVFKEAFKKFFATKMGSYILMIMIFAFAGGFEVINGILFSGDAITRLTIVGWLKEGFLLGASAGGIYSMGKSTLLAALNSGEIKKDISDIITDVSTKNVVKGIADVEDGIADIKKIADEVERTPGDTTTTTTTTTATT
jgi:hypothetical protein